jgi:hypothetical protein
MKRALWPLIPLVALVAFITLSAQAMDTKMAGRCVALGTLAPKYEAKAGTLLATASARGYRQLVEQRVREEFAYLAKVKHDQAAKEAWTLAAIQACGTFQVP